jgi:hypothetical protein
MDESFVVVLIIYLFILAITLTLSIIVLIWYVKTKNKLNAKGADIPTVWLIIIPFVGIYWLWKFSEGVELVTDKDMTAITAFLLILFLGPIGLMIIHSKIKKYVSETPSEHIIDRDNATYSYCHNCGHAISEQDSYCPQCGGKRKGG